MPKEGGRYRSVTSMGVLKREEGGGVRMRDCFAERFRFTPNLEVVVALDNLYVEERRVGTGRLRFWDPDSVGTHNGWCNQGQVSPSGTSALGDPIRSSGSLESSL